MSALLMLALAALTVIACDASMHARTCLHSHYGSLHCSRRAVPLSQAAFMFVGPTVTRKQLCSLRSMQQRKHAGLAVPADISFQRMMVARKSVQESPFLRASRRPCSALRAASARMTEKEVLAVDVSPLYDLQYVRLLATLCCESFYGEQKPWEKLNLYAQLQRGLVFQEIEQDLTMRMERYRKASGSPTRMCGALLTAVDEEGNLAGFVDLSSTLYNTQTNEFFVSKGPGLSVPGEEFERRPYIANLAVAPKFRRYACAHLLSSCAVPEAITLCRP